MELTLAKKIERDDKVAEFYKIGRYEVDHIVYKSGYRSVSIRSNRIIDRYMPEIYSVDDCEGTIFGFEIQTTSYGALSGEETKKVIGALKEATEVVEILTKEFVK